MNNRKQSLSCAYLLDGKGGGRKMDWSGIDAWTPEQGVLWTHVNFSTKIGKKWLHKHLDTTTYHVLTAEEVRPRTTIAANYLLIVLRGVNLNPRQDPEDMVSIRIYIDEHRIITTHQRKLLSVSDVMTDIESGNGPKNQGDFLALLNTNLTERMSDIIEEVNDDVDALEDEMLSEQSHTLRPKISEIRRQAIMLRRYLAPQREAIKRLTNEKIVFLNKHNQVQLMENIDKLMRYIEDLDAGRERATITHEELSSRLAEKMEKRMYLLAIVSVIFLPLSFITGLLGINVGGIPGAAHPLGFSIVTGFLGLVSGLVYTILRIKKWL